MGDDGSRSGKMFWSPLTKEIAIIKERVSMKISSIRFKLIVGGILIVLIPLAVSGYVAKNNSAAAVTTYSKANAQSIAEGLAMQVSATLEGEIKFATAFAGRTQVRIAAEAVQSKGIEGAAEAIEVIRKDLHKRFEQLKANYSSIVLTDANGKVYAAEATSEEELKGLDIAPCFPRGQKL